MGFQIIIMMIIIGFKCQIICLIKQMIESYFFLSVVSCLFYSVLFGVGVESRDLHMPG